MLIAAATKDGRRILVIGLMEENMGMLRDDRPIHKDLGGEGVTALEGWDLYVLGPEDTARFAAAYGVGAPGRPG